MEDVGLQNEGSGEGHCLTSEVSGKAVLARLSSTDCLGTESDGASPDAASPRTLHYEPSEADFRIEAG